MNTSESCTEILDRAGIDVLDAGCAWHEKATPLSAGDWLGMAVFIGSFFLLWAVAGKVRSRLRSPST